MTLECLPEVIKVTVENIIKLKFTGYSKLINAIEISNNTLSSSYKLQIENNNEIICLFIKYLNKNNSSFTTDAYKYFNNEITFYSCIVELFQKNLPLNCIPECIHVTNDEEKMLIFKHLNNHVSLNVNSNISVETARVILISLGHFHAYSFAMKDQNCREFQNAIKKLDEVLFNANNSTDYCKLFTRSIIDAFKLTKDALPKNSMYVDKLSVFVLNVLDDTLLLLKGDEDDEQYKVITHGDLWINNIMCKFSPETAVPENVIFTDFQGCRYASPIHDLMFIILVALNKDLRNDYHDELIRCYHVALCEKLQELGSDPIRLFPFSALKNQLHKHTRFVLAVALVGLPLFMSDNIIKLDDHSANAFHSLDEYLKCINNSKSMKCKNKMIEIIMDVIDQGYL